MKVAVIGGGINGVMTAWALALKGISVDLFEQRWLMGATSSAYTKLLHGGLRYLNAHFCYRHQAMAESVSSFRIRARCW
jgi:glycerol-3-phosphate dehydrogenase